MRLHTSVECAICRTFAAQSLVFTSFFELMVTLSRLVRRLRTYAGQLAVFARTPFTRPVDLVVLDDIFPQPLSSFRFVEFNNYLKALPGAVVHSSATAFRLVNEARTFAQVWQEYATTHPNEAPRVLLFNRWTVLRAKLAYLVFINNAYSFLPVLERHRIPFVFTLYPGGGFALDNPESDAKLRQVMNSPLFRHVIVTQNLTRNYLLSHNFCQAEQITLVYGVVLPENLLQSAGTSVRDVLGQGKNTFDICFVAHKYTARGVDKGYDTFIAVAQSLAKQLPQVRFHVVGPFNETDIDVQGLSGLTFYGPQRTTFFADFYSRMDVIVSPNVAFYLQPGAFDGFPTGSCVEAGLKGVTILCSDQLGQNMYLSDRKDIIITSNSVDEISEVLAYYYNHPQELRHIGQAGQQRMQELYSYESQMRPRLAVLQANL